MALLEIKDLTVEFGHGPASFTALDRLSLRLHHEETLNLVGESGSGKSLTALAIMGLLPQAARTSGTIRFSGETLLDNRTVWAGNKECGRGLAMVFQEPMGALNPSLKVMDLVGEAYRLRFSKTTSVCRPLVIEALRRTGIPDPVAVAARYPWQLSGGLAQRVMIASALILEPKVLVADEPTTALDVTTQARILRLLAKLRKETGMAMVFITHDLSVAALMGGTTAVMYGGQLMEKGPTRLVLEAPMHPYTQALLACTPAIALAEKRKRLSPGNVRPPAEDRPRGQGCTFSSRCPQAAAACAQWPPPTTRMNKHLAWCHQCHSDKGTGGPSGG